jgi:segregation and condensation protein B
MSNSLSDLPVSELPLVAAELVDTPPIPEPDLEVIDLYDAAELGLAGDELAGDNLEDPDGDAVPPLVLIPQPVLTTKVEAILYLKAQPLALATVAELVGCDRKTAKQALRALIDDYSQRQTALEVVETPNGYSLQLKASFQDLVQHLVPVDLGVAALRTLATIALRGPISQTDLVDFRGSGVYDHVKELVEQGFISKRRQANGRSFWLQVTDQFYQYFQMQGLPDLQLTAKGAKRRAEAAAKAAANSANDLASGELAVEQPESSQVELFAEAISAEAAEIAAQAPETPIELSVEPVDLEPDHPTPEA